MIRYRLRERISDLEFERGTRVTLAELEAATGVNKSTLSKLSRQRGYVTTTDVLNRLCRFFGCRISEIAEYVPDEEMRE